MSHPPNRSADMYRTRRRVFHSVLAALIAALYMTVTLVLAPISFGPVQLRLSEVLTILPALTPAAVPGLLVGCFLANLFNPNSLGMVDVIFGTLATTLAAYLTRRIAQRLRLDERHPDRRPGLPVALLILPSILLNALIVGTYLMILLEPAEARSVGMWTAFMGSVGFGQVLGAGIGGVMLYVAVRPFMVRLSHRYRPTPARGEVR